MLSLTGRIQANPPTRVIHLEKLNVSTRLNHLEINFIAPESGLSSVVYTICEDYIFTQELSQVQATKSTHRALIMDSAGAGPNIYSKAERTHSAMFTSLPASSLPRQLTANTR